MPPALGSETRLAATGATVGALVASVVALAAVETLAVATVSAAFTVLTGALEHPTSTSTDTIPTAPQILPMTVKVDALPCDVRRMGHSGSKATPSSGHATNARPTSTPTKEAPSRVRGAGLGDVIGAKAVFVGMLVVGAAQVGIQFWVRGAVTATANVVAYVNPESKVAAGPHWSPSTWGNRSPSPPWTSRPRRPASQFPAGSAQH